MDKVLSGLAQVHSLGAQLVAIKDNLSLRLVVFQIGVGVDKFAAGKGCPHQLLRDGKQLLRLARRRDHKVNRKVSSSGQRRRSQRNNANARDFRKWARGFEQQLLRGLLALAPRLGDHAAKAAGRRSDLENTLALRESMIDVVNLVGEQPGLIDGRIGRRLDDSENHTLVLGRSQFPLREHVERNHQHGDDRPQSEHHRPVAEGAAKSVFISAAYTFEAAIDPSCEPSLGVAGAQQLRSHHRRKRQCNDSGDDHSARQRECELPEQRAGQSALNADGCIHRGQCDGHRNDRAHQFTGGIQRSPLRRLAHLQMPLDVLHHDDRVIHHQADREHDGQQGQQVNGESEGEHQEDSANERNREWPRPG